MMGGREPSPFDTSGLSLSSPRGFWNTKTVSPAPFNENGYERPESPSLVRRRASIENLKKASRVKNSSMFAREQAGEYDPSSPVVDVNRPLAAGRPLSGAVVQNQNSSFINDGVQRMDFNPIAATANGNAGRGHHKRGESQNKIPIMVKQPMSPENGQNQSLPNGLRTPSPTKSSFANKGAHTLPRNYQRGFMFSDDGEEDDGPKMEPPRQLRRQAKSVTFDAAPPQVNEYEMQTPDPSSVASGSREGSYDYDAYEDEDGEMYDIDRAMGGGPGEDDSFDASLEDTLKTPVVMPEDWHGMSSDSEDPFQVRGQENGLSQDWNFNRNVSNDSDRPLPPVPKFSIEDNAESESRRNSGNVLDRVHNASQQQQRSLPTLPAPSSVTKSELLNMKINNTMTLEERLRLMGIRDSSLQKNKSQSLSPNSGDREKARLQRHGLGIHVYEDEQDAKPQVISATPVLTAPKISRESILKKVRSRNLQQDEERRLSELASSPPPYDIETLDPDMPLPSREGSEDHLAVKDEESLVDLYSIPAMYADREMSQDDQQSERDGSVVRHSVSRMDDSESMYSAHKMPQGASLFDGVRASTPDGSNALGLPELSSFLGENSMFQSGFQSYLSSASDSLEKKDSVPKPAEPVVMNSVHEFLAREATPEEQILEEVEEPRTPDSVIHLPSASSASDADEAPEPVEIPEPVATVKAPGGLKTRPSHTPADFATMAATRRQVSGSMMVPPVPERSPKRLSFTNAPEVLDTPEVEKVVVVEDKEIDRAVRDHKKRRESFKMKLDLPEESMLGDELGLGLDKEFDRVIEGSKVYDSLSLYQPSNHNLLFTGPSDQKPGFVETMERGHHVQSYYEEYEIENGYDIEKQNADQAYRTKKGYLMRQNTKVVVAKRTFSGEPDNGAPGERPMSADSGMMRTASGNIRPQMLHERTKSWTTEPWNGKTRRKSLRSVDKKSAAASTVSEAVGPETVVTGGLDTVLEDHSMHMGDEAGDWEDGVERGRLFVKVVGVKDLDLPMPQSKCYESSKVALLTQLDDRVWFQLTLDNGLHCVTTSRLELGRSAPIGQEFELVVLNDLEFQLTLQTQLTPPARLGVSNATVASKANTAAKTANKSTFSRLFTSPKKRKEQEKLLAQQREEQERAKQHRKSTIEAARRGGAGEGVSAWELLHELVSEEDGSFGRAYIALKNHEDACFGRPITVDIPVFNEWAVEDPNISSSVKSKRGTQVLRRPPYQIGNLTLQLLYVPRPKGAHVKEEDIPKSMNAAVREMTSAETAMTSQWEGFLSQQGGDCPYWRRRFFRLSGFDLTAYHETTMQRRVRISLAKATKLIDDKSSLLKPDAKGGAKRSGGRRKSAFADEDQAYMFVEEGFRIRFANGEAIDFYADSTDDKEGWMRALTTVVGTGKSNSSGQAPPGSKNGSAQETWCDVVLRRERALKEGIERLAGANPSASTAIASSLAPKSLQTTSTEPGSAIAIHESAVTTAYGETTNARPRSQPGMPAGSVPSFMHNGLPMNANSHGLGIGMDMSMSGATGPSAGQHQIPPRKSRHQYTNSQPSSPTKNSIPAGNKTLGHGAVRPRSQVGPQTQTETQGPAPGRLSNRRKQIKSMIF
jgi:hypothetical protein